MMLPMSQLRMTVGASRFFSSRVRRILSENFVTLARSLILASMRMKT